MPNGGSSAGQAYYGNYFEDETGGYSASARSAGSRIDLNSDTYIVRDGDDLWLVMGGIKAKLDVLVYSDPTKSDVSKLSEDVMKALNGGLDHNVAEGNRSARRDDSTRQNKNSLTATPVY
jgi:hypothetical protein